MAVVDDKAHWAARVEQLDMDVLEGEKRLEALVKAVSGLIAEDADSKKIAAAKRVADEAHRDLGHLRGALGEAQLRHRKELEAQEIEVLRQRADKIEKFQRKHSKLLAEADATYRTFLGLLEETDDCARDIHVAAAGCRTVGEALNSRHGSLVTWLIVRLLHTIPITEVHIGNAVANHRAGKAQIGDKGLVDFQPDFAEMFRQFHAEKDKAA